MGRPCFPNRLASSGHRGWHLELGPMPGTGATSCAASGASRLTGGSFGGTEGHRAHGASLALPRSVRPLLAVQTPSRRSDAPLLDSRTVPWPASRPRRAPPGRCRSWRTSYRSGGQLSCYADAGTDGHASKAEEAGQSTTGCAQGGCREGLGNHTYGVGCIGMCVATAGPRVGCTPRSGSLRRGAPHS